MYKETAVELLDFLKTEKSSPIKDYKFKSRVQDSWSAADLEVFFENNNSISYSKIYKSSELPNIGTRQEDSSKRFLLEAVYGIIHEANEQSIELNDF